MTAAHGVQGGEQLMGLHLFTVDRHQIAALEIQLDYLRLIGRFLQRHREAPHALCGRLTVRIFEHATFVRNMQQIGIH